MCLNGREPDCKQNWNIWDGGPVYGPTIYFGCGDGSWAGFGGSIIWHANCGSDDEQDEGGTDGSPDESDPDGDGNPDNDPEIPPGSQGGPGGKRIDDPGGKDWNPHDNPDCKMYVVTTFPTVVGGTYNMSDRIPEATLSNEFIPGITNDTWCKKCDESTKTVECFTFPPSPPYTGWKDTDFKYYGIAGYTLTFNRSPIGKINFTNTVTGFHEPHKDVVGPDNTIDYNISDYYASWYTSISSFGSKVLTVGREKRTNPRVCYTETNLPGTPTNDEACNNLYTLPAAIYGTSRAFTNIQSGATGTYPADFKNKIVYPWNKTDGEMCTFGTRQNCFPGFGYVQVAQGMTFFAGISPEERFVLEGDPVHTPIAPWIWAQESIMFIDRSVSIEVGGPEEQWPNDQGLIKKGGIGDKRYIIDIHSPSYIPRDMRENIGPHNMFIDGNKSDVSGELTIITGNDISSNIHITRTQCEDLGGIFTYIPNTLLLHSDPRDDFLCGYQCRSLLADFSTGCDIMTPEGYLSEECLALAAQICPSVCGICTHKKQSEGDVFASIWQHRDPETPAYKPTGFNYYSVIPINEDITLVNTNYGNHGIVNGLQHSVFGNRPDLLIYRATTKLFPSSFMNGYQIGGTWFDGFNLYPCVLGMTCNPVGRLQTSVYYDKIAVGTRHAVVTVGDYKIQPMEDWDVYEENHTTAGLRPELIKNTRYLFTFSGTTFAFSSIPSTWSTENLETNTIVSNIGLLNNSDWNSFKADSNTAPIGLITYSDQNDFIFEFDAKYLVWDDFADDGHEGTGALVGGITYNRYWDSENDYISFSTGNIIRSIAAYPFGVTTSIQTTIQLGATGHPIWNNINTMPKIAVIDSLKLCKKIGFNNAITGSWDWVSAGKTGETCAVLNCADSIDVVNRKFICWGGRFDNTTSFSQEHTNIFNEILDHTSTYSSRSWNGPIEANHQTEVFSPCQIDIKGNRPVLYYRSDPYSIVGKFADNTNTAIPCPAGTFCGDTLVREFYSHNILGKVKYFDTDQDLWNTKRGWGDTNRNHFIRDSNNRFPSGSQKSAFFIPPDDVDRHSLVYPHIDGSTEMRNSARPISSWSLPYPVISSSAWLDNRYDGYPANYDCINCPTTPPPPPGLTGACCIPQYHDNPCKGFNIFNQGRTRCVHVGGQGTPGNEHENYYKVRVSPDGTDAGDYGNWTSNYNGTIEHCVLNNGEWVGAGTTCGLLWSIQQNGYNPNLPRTICPIKGSCCVALAAGVKCNIKENLHSTDDLCVPNVTENTCLNYFRDVQNNPICPDPPGWYANTSGIWHHGGTCVGGVNSPIPCGGDPWELPGGSGADCKKWACCLNQGICQKQNKYDCDANNGSFFENQLCSDDGFNCGSPDDIRACCTLDGCTDTIQLYCTDGDWIFNKVCLDTPCGCCNYFTGPCCRIGAPCEENTTPTQCHNMAGIFLGFDRTCEDCGGGGSSSGGGGGSSSGACCSLEGVSCVSAPSEDHCGLFWGGYGGIWQGPGTSCVNGKCPP